MCIGFIKTAKSMTDRYKLIILNNRDEYLDRLTTSMHWHDGILSGVDQKDAAAGTWIGINENASKIGMLLSITQPAETKMLEAPSRGGIVNSYLNSPLKTPNFLENLEKSAKEYNGFQFVGIEKVNGLYSVHTLTNHFVDKIETRNWENSEYLVFSNSPPEVPFLKTQYGLEIFGKKLADSNSMDVAQVFEQLFQIGTNRTRCCPDPQISFQTGHADEKFNEPFSSIFVRFPTWKRYGTRSHTLITVDQNDRVTVVERKLIENQENIEESTWHDEKFEFYAS